MHIAIPTFDRTVPMSVNIFHAEAATRIWTQQRNEIYAAHVDRLLAAGVIFGRQPIVEEVEEESEPTEWDWAFMMSPSPWFVESEWIEAVADDEARRLDGCREPDRDDDIDTQALVAVVEEDEPCLRAVDDETVH
jgi:hypothetical protein